MNPWSAEHRLGALRKGIETGRDGARRSDRGAVHGFKARNSFRRILILTFSLGEKEQPLAGFIKSASLRALGSLCCAKTLGAFLTLPQGEGRGEGEASVIPTATSLVEWL